MKCKMENSFFLQHEKKNELRGPAKSFQNHSKKGQCDVELFENYLKENETKRNETPIQGLSVKSLLSALIRKENLTF